jgi:predicted acylesterase/phospholipase RssA
MNPLSGIPKVVGQAANDAARTVSAAIGFEPGERWSREQVEFSGGARAAARRALWFLRLVEKGCDEATRKHSQRSAAEQLARVQVPPRTAWCTADSPKERCTYSPTLGSFVELSQTWNRLQGRLGAEKCVEGMPGESSTLSVGELREVEKALEHFMKRSTPLDPAIHLTYARFPAIKQYFRQHFALIVALVFGVGVVLFVEALRSLVLNQPGFTLGLAAGTIAIPWLVLKTAEWLLGRFGRPAPWNLGSRVAYAWPASLEPAPWIPWHLDPESTFRIYWSLLLKLLLYIGLWIIGGLLYQGMIGAAWAQEQGLTVYLIAVVLALFVLVGNIVDFADMHSQAPLRGLVLVGAVSIMGMALLTDNVWWIGGVALAWALATTWWTFHVRHKRVLVVLVPLALGVMIAVATTRARSRQAVWEGTRQRTDASLRANEWPLLVPDSSPIVVVAASGGGSRAAVFTALTLDSLDRVHPRIAANIQAISSVSGGSLASASYIVQRLRRDSTLPDSVNEKCEPNSLADAADQDFLRPTLAGVLRDGRGKAIERAWEECPVGLGRVRISTLSTLWQSAVGQNANRVPFPIPIFNSVTLERNAVVISPLNQALFESVFEKQARSKANAYNEYLPLATWVYYRSAIYHVNDLVPGYDAPLSSAVRASANFPFGFPLVEVAASEPLSYSPAEQRRLVDTAHTRAVHLTDGGALSNSGLWPLVPLLVNQRDRIGPDRGVLLIVVNASRMPTAGFADRQLGLIGTLFDQGPKGERLHIQMLEQLQHTFGGCFNVVQIAIQPKAEFNVHTTWALDRRSLEAVESAFKAAWPKASDELGSAAAALAGCKRNGPLAKLFPARVPLS